MVLFPSETNTIKNHIINDEFIEAKTKINDVIEKAYDFGFGIDGFLIGELTHLKVHVDAYLGIKTEGSSTEEFHNKILSSQRNQKYQCIETINVIRNIQ